MTLTAKDYYLVRNAIAAISGDVSNDAVGAHAPKLEDIYAPETHAAALDPTTPIIMGSRGTGKSFWSGVLGQVETNEAAAKAYPKLGLKDVKVDFGFTGIGGPEGIGVDALNSCVPPEADIETAKAFWWATILKAVAAAADKPKDKWPILLKTAGDWEAREELLANHERLLRAAGKTLLIVYDALDMVAITWPRRRLLTEALLDVVWAMRAYRAIRLKLFVRPDQIEDDALRFVELPKLRTGTVRVSWSGTDLYGLLFARLALIPEADERRAFGKLLRYHNIREGDREAILSRSWPLSHDVKDQVNLMCGLAGPFMSAGPYGYKKGKTYGWPLTHLADAFDGVTPRSFLGLMIAAAKYGVPPTNQVITPDGIRHGLRAASKTRVDQLHQEFPWIKGVLAPLAGLLLPQEEKEVFQTWKRTKTIRLLLEDASTNKYLPPFPNIEGKNDEKDLSIALEHIGVMFRRKDNRIDMPDLFRVAAKLLKKGGTAPI
jgi:hypothetical protein